MSVVTALVLWLAAHEKWPLVEICTNVSAVVDCPIVPFPFFSPPLLARPFHSHTQLAIVSKIHEQARNKNMFPSPSQAIWSKTNNFRNYESNPPGLVGQWLRGRRYAIVKMSICPQSSVLPHFHCGSLLWNVTRTQSRNISKLRWRPQPNHFIWQENVQLSSLSFYNFTF